MESARNLVQEGLQYISREKKAEIIGAYAGAEKRHPGEVPVRNMVEGAGQLAEQLKAEDLAESCIGFLELQGEAAGCGDVLTALNPH